MKIVSVFQKAWSLCFPFKESRTTILRLHRYNSHDAGLVRRPVYRGLDKAGIRVRFQTVQTGSGVHLASYSVGVLEEGGSSRVKKLTIHLQLVPRWWMWSYASSLPYARRLYLWGNIPQYPLIGGCVCPRAGPDGLEKDLPHAGSRITFSH
jgi:hypothetical protein